MQRACRGANTVGHMTLSRYMALLCRLRQSLRLKECFAGIWKHCHFGMVDGVIERSRGLYGILWHGLQARDETRPRWPCYIGHPCNCALWNTLDAKTAAR